MLNDSLCFKRRVLFFCDVSVNNRPLHPIYWTIPERTSALLVLLAFQCVTWRQAIRALCKNKILSMRTRTNDNDRQRAPNSIRNRIIALVSSVSSVTSLEALVAASKTSSRAICTQFLCIHQRANMWFLQRCAKTHRYVLLTYFFRRDLMPLVNTTHFWLKVAHHGLGAEYSAAHHVGRALVLPEATF